MPGKGLFSSLADKAHQAIQQSPLGARLSSDQPATGASTTSAPSGSTAPTAPGQQAYKPPAQEQSGSLSGRHHGIESLSHQLRSLQVQYSSGASQENHQLQLMITAQKGVALDFDNAGRNSKAQSKDLYLWGQTQDPDIKDVTDRLAYLNFVHGALSYTLATDIDKSRQAWKNVRDAEAQLAPRRANRFGLQQQIAKLKTEGKGSEGRIQELVAQLQKTEADDAPLERELGLLKRVAIKESETIKWKALREYGQKLALLAGASEQLLHVLPSSPAAQYNGAQQTAAVRSALQQALDSGYVPPVEHLPLNVGNVASAKGETRSFGETHASELTTIASAADHGHDPVAPIDPNALNNNQAQIPHYSAPTTAPPVPGNHHYHAPGSAPPSAYAAHAVSDAPSSNISVPHGGPTVAEAGVPLTAGAEGPGPATGTLGDKDESRDRPAVGYGVGSPGNDLPGYGAPPAAAGAGALSAEEEKRRLAAAHSAEDAAVLPSGGLQGGLVASTSTRRPPTHESAEDEKKRLEREERERVLRANTVDSTQSPTEGAAPPAYNG